MMAFVGGAGCVGWWKRTGAVAGMGHDRAAAAAAAPATAIAASPAANAAAARVVMQQHASNSASAWKWSAVGVADAEELVSAEDAQALQWGHSATEDEISSSGADSSAEEILAVRDTMGRTLDGRVWLKMVKDAQRRHDAQKAREILSVALQRLPTDASLLLASAKLERSRHRYESARKLFRRCYECDPEFSPNLIAWSSMESRLGRPEAARAVLQDGIDALTLKKSSSARLSHTLAMLERNEGRDRAAKDTLMRGLKKDSVNPFLNQALAVIEYDAGRCDRAREFLQVATRAHPEHVLSWFTRGVVEEAEGDLQKARLSFASGATKKGPGSLLLWHAWIALEVESGDRSKAVELCELAVRRFPHVASFCASWALLLKEAGDVVGARKVAKQGLAVDESCGLVWMALATIERDDGDHWKARQAYAAGARKSRLSAVCNAVLARWAVMELCLGEEARAQKLLTRAKAISGTQSADELLPANVERCYEIANDPYLARSALAVLVAGMNRYSIPKVVPRARRSVVPRPVGASRGVAP